MITGHMNNSGVNGSGPLRHILEDAAATGGYSMKELTVLAVQRDPYRLDTPSGHRDAAWVGKIVHQMLGETKKAHLRGLHYLIVAAANVFRGDNGLPFTNTEENWLYLTEVAAKAARWLGYVPFERIVDERNAPPELFIPEDGIDNQSGLTNGAQVDIPSLDDAVPTLYSSGFRVKQPYRIILIGEKTSLREVLLPIAQMVGGELLLPTGEMSDTMIAGIARRAAGDSRPSVVLYFSDFDPSGHQMPISVARKLQALRDLLYPELNIQVHHVALTLDQVRRLQLPSTPLKETERRGDHWRAVTQHEQTEIDALAALRPGDLRQIALDAIKPFYDDTLRARVNEAESLWQEEAEVLLTSHPGYQAAVDDISTALEVVQEEAETFHGAQEAAREAFQDVELPPIVTPEPIIETEAPQPLFTTDDDYVTASRRLIDHKALGNA
jgi:hypothetical protein